MINGWISRALPVNGRVAQVANVINAGQYLLHLNLSAKFSLRLGHGCVITYLDVEYFYLQMP